MLPNELDRSPLTPLTPPMPGPLTLRAPHQPATPRAARPAAPAYRGLPRPIRLFLYAAAAVIIGAVLGATAPSALRRLGAVAALQPGLLAWYSVRALGFMAYLVVAGSVVYGLLLSTKILDTIAHRPVSFALHKDLAIAGVVLAVLHAGILLADASFDFTLRAILVPFASPYAALWVGVGQLAFYGLAVVTASFYVRRQIGQRAWRILHYLTFLVFVGATGHGIMAGSDSGSGWAFWIYLVPGAMTMFLLVYRIAVSVAAHLPHSRPEATALPVRPASGAPIPFPAGRAPVGRPASFTPPMAGPSFD